MRERAAHAAAGHGGLAGIDERDGPVLFLMLVVERDFRLSAELQRHVAAMPLVIIEVLLDHLALVAKAEDEFLEPVVGVEFHNMPEDRARSDRHHGLRSEFRFLAQARAQSAAENDDFHNLKN